MIKCTIQTLGVHLSQSRQSWTSFLEMNLHLGADLHENTHSAGQSWKFEVQYFMKQVFKCPIDLPAKFD